MNRMNSSSTRLMFGSLVSRVRWEVVMTKESGAQRIRYRLGNVPKRHPFVPQTKKSPKKKKNGVPGAGNQWCQPQISKFLRFIISTTRIATKIVTELCTQSATHSYAKVMTRNDQGKHRGLEGPTMLTQNRGMSDYCIHKMHGVFLHMLQCESILVHVLWMFYGYIVGKS